MINEKRDMRDPGKLGDKLLVASERMNKRKRKHFLPLSKVYERMMKGE